MSRAVAYHDAAPRPFIKRVMGPLFVVSILFYLGFHAFSGERGLFALFTESQRLEALKSELADVKAQREALDLKVKHLSDASLDLDLLDEQAKRVLGRADKGEVVYLLNRDSVSIDDAKQ